MACVRMSNLSRELDSVLFNERVGVVYGSAAHDRLVARERVGVEKRMEEHRAACEFCLRGP